MIKKTTFFFMAFLGLSFNLFAQQNSGTIKGTIQTNDNKPASSVTVRLTELNKTTISDNNGSFTVRNVPAGKYTIAVSLIGYESISQSVNISAGQTTEVALRLSVSENQLQEVIITSGNRFKSTESDDAGKIPLNYLENSQSYSTVTKDLMKDQVLFTVDEAMRNVSGVQQMWQPTGRAGDGGSWFALRGFPTNINMRNGFASMITTSTDAANVEKVEILKGPSSTLFGGGVITSYGGIMNKVTKTPYDHFGGEVNFSGGSYDFYRGSLDINTPIDKDKKWMFRFNGAYNAQGSFQKEAGTSRRTFLAPSLLFKPNERLSVELNTELTYATSVPGQFVFLYFSPAELGFDNAGGSGLDYKQSYAGKDISTTSRSSNYYANVSYKISEEITSSTNVSYSRSYSDGQNQYFFQIPNYLVTENPADYGIPSTYLARADQSTRNSYNKIFQVQQYFNGDFNIGSLRNRTVFGLDYTDIGADIHFFSQPNYIDVVPTNIPGFDYTTFNKAAIENFYNTASPDLVQTYPVISTTNIYSTFVSDVLDLTDNFSVLAALRLDHFRNKDKAYSTSYNQTTLSPKFGLVYQPVKDQLSLFANYQNSFSNQGSYIAYDQNSPDTLASKFARPEHANQWEAGVKSNLISNKLTATLSYYHIKVDDMLRADPRDPGRAQIQNGSQISRGFELEIISNPAKGLNIVGGLAYNDSKYENASDDLDGHRYAYAGAPWLANVWLSYKFDNTLRGLHLGIGGNYASENPISDTESNGKFVLPAYTVFNATTGYDFKRFSIAVKADNFTNKHYWQGFSTYNPQTLRQFVGSVTYKF